MGHEAFHQSYLNIKFSYSIYVILAQVNIFHTKEYFCYKIQKASDKKYGSVAKVNAIRADCILAVADYPL